MQASSNLLSPPSLAQLKEKKNLLAFSAGVDSTALFFLLVKADIPFDIAIVDYNLRAQSKEEVAHAKTLATSHQKLCYHDSVHLSSSNFEHQAREHRYAFFEDIIHAENYDNLITAHQLNDKLEWFLMQLGRGAGLVEMLGYEEVSERKGYTLLRPLILTDKNALLDFLHTHDIKYFIDESNYHDSYARNRVRAEFSDDFLKNYKQGVLKSFDYLGKDKESLFQHQVHYHDKKLTILKRSKSEMRSIDKVCKEMGYLLSSAQKEEIQRVESSVMGDKIVIAFSESFVFIAPFVQVVMDKKHKERCRVLGIPAKIRPYLTKEDINLNDLPLD